MANILATLFGGGGDHPLDGEMPGQFEEYSPTKAGLSGKLGSTHEGQPHQLNYAIRAANKGVPAGRYGDWAKFVHDSLFGGEAHTRGPIPRSTSPHEFTRAQEQARALEDMNNLHEMLQRSNAHQARERAVAEMLRAHGLDPNHPELHSVLAEHMAAAHEGAPHVRVGLSDGAVHEYSPEMRNAIVKNRAGGSLTKPNAARQAALQRLLSARMHNHRN